MQGGGLEACKILLAGYDGFSKYWPNPAGELAERFDGVRVAGCRVIGVVLPVSFSSVKARLPQLLAAADAAVGVGLDPSAAEARLELAAANVAHWSMPDIDGVRVELDDVVNGAPLALPATLPYKAVVKACSERGLPLRPGVGAGTYLCNAMAYTLYHWAHSSSKPAGFIHIPPDTATAMRVGSGQGVPMWLLEETLRCILEAVAGLVKGSL